MVLTVEWNGVPASYLGALTNVDILKADLFRNLQDCVDGANWFKSNGENGKTNRTYEPRQYPVGSSNIYGYGIPAY